MRVRKRLSKNFTFIMERSAVSPQLRVFLLQGTVLIGEELVAVLNSAELLEVPMLQVASGTVIRDEGMVLLGKAHVGVAENLERGLSIGKILR